jgi:hypothetical protein
MSDIDLPVADSAYAKLLDARHKPRNTAADLARPLMNETENLGVRPHEIEIMKADAWLAICALCKSLDSELESISTLVSSQMYSRVPL